eukprot:TRINITY_DN6_c0_g2_i1.p1 TRINITY_DN6_c0_g2~~TRINITY_DN6_c0_g2_i1.p1  ORF type:complete len:327 (-),score=65.10 TRINITY_DN6_c0_g2_i1:186-1166(-)
MVRFLAWTVIALWAEISLCSPTEHGFDGAPYTTVSSIGADEMSAAVNAAKSMVGAVKNVVNGIISEVNAAHKQIADMKAKAVDFAEMNLPEFTKKVADAIVDLSSNQVRAVSLYQNMHGIISNAVADLTEKFAKASEKEQNDSCLAAQAAMLATMETADTTMKDILNKQEIVNTRLQEVHDLSKLYETTVKDKIENKRGWLSNKEKTLREEVYIPCCIASLILCPAICVPILESKIHGMENDLNDALKKMRQIASDFDGIANKADTLLTDGKNSYKDMADTEPKLETIVNMEKLTVTVFFWKTYILKSLEELDTLLVQALQPHVIV